MKQILGLHKTSHHPNAASTESEAVFSKEGEAVASSTEEKQLMAGDGALGGAGILGRSSKYLVEKVAQLTPTSLMLGLVSNGEPLQFEPGQYIALSVQKGNRFTPVRCFSIASSPNSSELQVGVRVSGPFTRMVARLQMGDKVVIEGPYGTFTPDLSHSRPLVMIAAGIGITPFVSMLRSMQTLETPSPTALLTFNRDETEIPFFDELHSYAQKNTWLRTGFFVDKVQNIKGLQQGKINEQIIRQITSHSYVEADYFICGPPRFMDYAVKLLKDHGVEDYRIETEAFGQGNKGDGIFTPARITFALASLALIGTIGLIGVHDLQEHVKAAAQPTTIVQTPVANDDSSEATTEAPSTSTVTVTPATPTTNTAPNPAINTMQTYQPPQSRVS